MPEHLFFFLGLGLLLTHEMDAVRVKEWKIFPGLTRMGDEAGYVVFTALHAPFYALLLGALYSGRETNFWLIFCLDVFFVVHVFLHLILYNHQENRFRSAFSYSLILGAGVFGILDLAWRS